MNSVQKAEQAVKNAQNQLDEAVRQLEAAKTWNFSEPDSPAWVFCPLWEGVPILFMGDNQIYFPTFVTGPRGACARHSVSVLRSSGWRYAEKGEVNISW